MIKKKLTKLIGLRKDEFDYFRSTNQIQAQKARLIPTYKIGDEMSLTSIFLSTLRLVNEYRNEFFKEIKLSRGGKAYYFTEFSIPELSKNRIDGLIIVVKGGVIVDAALFEMKNKSNQIEQEQIEDYIALTKKLGVKTFVTVSNEVVSNSSQSPVKIRVPKSINLFHFSWTYLLIKGQLLLFENDYNIEDHDQVEIMKEVLTYMENPVSGVKGYTRMKPGWKELAENIRAHKPIRISDPCVTDAVLSWYEEERDMALLVSRNLGVLVKNSAKKADSLKNDIRKLVKENMLTGALSVKNSVSDIRMLADFERRTVSMTVKVLPPLDKGTKARITWIGKQLGNCKKKSEPVFNRIAHNIWVSANVKYGKAGIKVKLSELETLPELTKGKEIVSFNISLINSFGANFASSKKFIELIEEMVMDYYEGVVQHMINWNKPAPKVNKQS